MASAASLFAGVAAAHALAVMSPGPDFAIVSRQALAHGRAAGMRTALGIACGLAIHVSYGLFGLAWAIHRYPPLLVLLRYLGAALLLWIGWGALRAPPGAVPAGSSKPAAARDFSIGFFTNALNVKAMLFFVALGSAVAAAGPGAGLRLALGVWMVFATGAWFCFLAWTLGHPGVRARLFAYRHWIDRVMGVVLMGLGLALLLQGLRETLL